MNLPESKAARARVLDAAALQALIRGASVLGTGGGGSYSRARELVHEIAALPDQPRLVDITALPADALGVSTAVLGGGLSHAEVERLERMASTPPALRGAHRLERLLGRRIDFVYALEIGPQNTLEAIRLAALLNVPVVDGDCAGRAVPELQQTTLSLFQIALAPYAVASFQGDTLLVTETASDSRNEALCRALAQASGGIVALTGFPATTQALRPALIPATLTQCLALGEEIGPSRQPGERLARIGAGRVAFRGRVSRFTVGNRDGFFRGWLDLNGSHEFTGQRYRIGIQNEFMWSWRDGEVDVRCPELICVIDSDSGIGKVTYGQGFENAIEVDEDLTVLQLPSAAVWRSDPAQRLFPPPPTLGQD